MDDISRHKARYAAAIEDGRRIEAFTNLDEWRWYVENVVQPTIDEYTNRIMTGELPTDKEDWIMRGMVMGMKLVIETTTGFKSQADDARKKAKALQEYIDDES